MEPNGSHWTGREKSSGTGVREGGNPKSLREKAGGSVGSDQKKKRRERETLKVNQREVERRYQRSTKSRDSTKTPIKEEGAIRDNHEVA